PSRRKRVRAGRCPASQFARRGHRRGEETMGENQPQEFASPAAADRTFAGDRKRVQVVGATGYGGLGIVELLLEHPGFEIAALAARDDAGKRMDEVYPHLT